MNIIERLIAIIAPHECINCGNQGNILCKACRPLLTPVASRCYRCSEISEYGRTCKSCRRSSPLQSVRVLTEYEGLAKTLVWRLKFDHARAAGDEIGVMLSSLVVESNLLVVHVPTASSRVRKRGYDQSALIARGLARVTGNVYSPSLARIGQHKQVGQTRAVRKQQLENAFRVCDIKSVHNAHVLLVDDVMTTGATLEAAAIVLKVAGAKKVDAIVFARA